MNGIYIYSTNEKDYKSNGESKKVLSQIKAFEHVGVNIKLLDVILDHKLHKIMYRLPGFGVYSNSFIKRCLNDIQNIDFVYIRKNIFDKTYYKLLKEIRKKNPRITIIVEIPTYPYFQEWGRLIDKPLIWKEKRIIPLISNNDLVDYYTTLSDDDFIFNIPTIKLNNCINIDDVTPKHNIQKKGEINMIGVALLASWHGYDRVIKGLRNYYKGDVSKNVFFHIVGEGPELNNLKSLTKEFGLDDYIIFEGKLNGDKLDYIYDHSNIGIGSLAPYRIDLIGTKSLKSREYCAKGIPYIKAGIDETFDSYKYCLTFPNNDTPIDINQILSFVDNIDYEAAVKEMREYARVNLSWEKYIKDILSRIKCKERVGE